MSAENDGNSIPTETDPMIGTVETEYVLAGIEAIGNSRTGPLLAGKTLTSRDSGKYETFSHMSDVVDEVLSRSGISLQEISRKGMSETHIESAQRSQIGMLQKVNQYTVTAEIARGSFGVVYLVESDFDNNGTLYAMKTFPAAKVKSLPRGRMPGPSKESNELQSIRKEIALMKKLIHPNITRLYEVHACVLSFHLFLIRSFMYSGCGGEHFPAFYLHDHGVCWGRGHHVCTRRRTHPLRGWRTATSAVGMRAHRRNHGRISCQQIISTIYWCNGVSAY